MSSRASSPTPAPVLDPMAAMLQRVSAARDASTAHRRAFSDTDGPGDDDDAGASDDSLFLTGHAGTISIAGTPAPFPPPLLQMEFRMRAQAFKKQRTLTPRSEEDFDAYTNTPCPAEHLLCLYHATLENRDLLTLLSAGKAYSIPEDVKDAITIYSQAFILSPAILGYKKKTGPATVLATLRAQGVSSIPPEHDQGRAQVILKSITKALTDTRHQVKDEIQSSIESFKKYGKGSPGTDIASLTEACIGSAKTKATLGLFMRVAFLRWVMTEYPDKVGRFWDEVDTRLDEIRKTQKTAAEREAAAQLVYDEDVEKYGPPDPECPPISPDRLEDWIRTVNRYASASLSSPSL